VTAAPWWYDKESPERFAVEKTRLFDETKEGEMKTLMKIGVLVVCVGLVLPAAGLNAAEKKESAGAKLFQQHCAACHPNGGNIIKPAMTLHKKDMDANGVKTAQDIVGKMRNPGPGMTRFDAKTISDKDAKEIAQYVLTTFK
jgi:cytochrome c6